jgi:hypothetical protein
MKNFLIALVFSVMLFVLLVGVVVMIANNNFTVLMAFSLPLSSLVVITVILCDIDRENENVARWQAYERMRKAKQ